MRDTPKYLDFCSELTDLLFRLAFQLDPLDSYNTTAVEIQCFVDRSELPSTDAFAKLLQTELILYSLSERITHVCSSSLSSFAHNNLHTRTLSR